MKRDHFFDRRRFALLFRYNYSLEKKNAARFLVAFYFVGLAFSTFVQFANFERWETRFNTNALGEFFIFKIMFIVTCIICFPKIFMGMAAKTHRMNLFMLPVTPFEKFSMAVLLYAIIYPLLLVLAFVLADFTRVGIFTLLYPGRETGITLFHYLCKIAGEFIQGRMPIRVFTASFFIIQSVLLISCAIWNKSVFKSALATSISMFLFVAIFPVLAVSYYDPVPDEIFDTVVLLPFLNILPILLLVFTLNNWVLAYFRFKEIDLVETKR